MIPADLPNGVVRVDKINAHVDGALAGPETGGCNGGAWGRIVEDGGRLWIPALVRVISSLNEFKVVTLEPDPIWRGL
jgi:hypothetical protein